MELIFIVALMETVWQQEMTLLPVKTNSSSAGLQRTSSVFFSVCIKLKIVRFFTRQEHERREGGGYDFQYISVFSDSLPSAF